MSEPLRILMVEDTLTDAELIQYALKHHGIAYEARRVETEPDFLRELEAFAPDVVISDYSLPEFSGARTIELARENAPDVPVIMATIPVNEETAVTCMKAGACDYVLKDRLSRIGPAVLAAVEKRRSEAARKEAEESLRVMEYEMRFARQIQQRLYPRHAPAVEGFDIGGVSYSAMAAGGDYYDYFQDRAGRIVVCVADAIGHGLGAALLMALLRGYLRAFARLESDLNDVLSQANKFLINEVADDYFCTATLSVLNPETSCFSYVNAGHPPGFLIEPSGAVREELGSTAFPLGVTEDAEYPEPTQITVAPGELIFFTTDGVNESWSHAEDAAFGTERAVDVIKHNRHRSAIKIADALCDAAMAFAGRGEQTDDMTAVVIKEQT